MRTHQVADDVAGVTLARQKKTIALSLQLDAARDIREQLKQCYRTHGMNHQDKCKVRCVNLLSFSSLQTVRINCHAIVCDHRLSHALPSLVVQELVQEFRKASNAYVTTMFRSCLPHCVIRAL